MFERDRYLRVNRYGITNVLIPAENEKDFIEDIPADIKEEINVHLVDTMDELLVIILERPIKIKNITSTVIRPYLCPEIQ